MKQFKRAKVIMLPTKNETNIILFGSKLRKKLINLSSRSVYFQNLYIISDDEIKEGDWFMMNTKEIGKCDNNVIELSEKFLNINNVNCKKIIATTDNSLTISKWSQTNKKSKHYNIQSSIETTKLVKVLLSQPSQQFIEKYIESYNKGKVITDVLVEYNGIVKHCGGDFIPDKYELKVNQNNTINIQLPKDSWNREEVIELLNNFNETIPGILKTNSDKILSTPTMDKWIKNNL